MAVKFGSKDENRLSDLFVVNAGRWNSEEEWTIWLNTRYNDERSSPPRLLANNQFLPEYNNIAMALRRNENKFLSFWTYGNGGRKRKREAGKGGGGRILSFRVHLCWQCARVISYFTERQRLLSFVFLLVSSVFSELLSERPKNNVNVNNTHVKSVMKNARMVETVVWTCFVCD